MNWIRLAIVLSAPLVTLHAQVTLSGTSYFQDFNTLGSGLPAGWTVSTGATSTTFGSSVDFASTKTDWSATLATEPLNFRNISSANILSTSSSVTQSANTNRALGWRPATADSRNGAVTFAINNSIGLSNFTLSLTLFSPNNVSMDQTYAVEYRVGNSGTFTQIGATYTTGNVFDATTITANSVTLAALNNQANPIYIRVRGTTSSGTNGSGLDVLGIDDFSLSYAAVPEPATTVAIVAGAALLGAALYRRRSRGTPVPARG